MIHKNEFSIDFLYLKTHLDPSMRNNMSKKTVKETKPKKTKEVKKEVSASNKEYKARLDQLQKDTEETLDNTLKALDSLESNDDRDEFDKSANLAEISRNNELKRQQEIRLQQIKAANIRMEQGKFGVCISCEDEIPKKRLMANPLSIRCLPCQEELELFAKEDKLRGRGTAVPVVEEED